jgi:hypothetical protein
MEYGLVDIFAIIMFDILEVGNPFHTDDRRSPRYVLSVYVNPVT